jgi:hypothetical protein
MPSSISLGAAGLLTGEAKEAVTPAKKTKINFLIWTFTSFSSVRKSVAVAKIFAKALAKISALQKAAHNLI